MSRAALENLSRWCAMASAFFFTTKGASEAILDLIDMAQWAALVIAALLALGIVSTISSAR